MAEVGGLPGLPPELAAELHEMKKRIEEILEALNEDVAEKVGLPWKVDLATQDIVLEPDPIWTYATLPGIGAEGASESPAFVAVGDTVAMQGGIVARDDGIGGGVILLGYKPDPDNPPPVGQIPPPSQSALIGGTNIVTYGGPIYAEVGAPHTEDRYALWGETISVVGGDGVLRHLAPLMVGPRFVYSLPPERAENPNDSLVVSGSGFGSEIGWVSLTLGNSYPTPSDVTISLGIQLEETSGRAVDFTLVLRRNGIIMGETTITRSGSNDFFESSGAVADPMVATDVLTLDVEASGTHPQSRGWIRGSIRAAYIEVKQG